MAYLDESGVTELTADIKALADADYAPIASPTFTGTPAAPTAATGTDTTQLATTAFVQQEITANEYSLPSDLEVDNLEVTEQANIGETLMVGATGNQIADTVIARGGSVSVGTMTNNAKPSVSLNDSNNAVSFIINGSNRGIYDTTNSKWIVYSGSDNVTVANGLAASASGTSTSTNNFWTFINASTGMGVRFVLNPNTLNFVVMYTLNGGSTWSGTKSLASWS